MAEKPVWVLASVSGRAGHRAVLWPVVSSYKQALPELQEGNRAIPSFLGCFHFSLFSSSWLFLVAARLSAHIFSFNLTAAAPAALALLPVAHSGLSTSTVD